MSYLADISRLTGQNMGGLIHLQVARAADIVSINEAVNGVVYGEITFLEGKGFHTWYSTSQTMKLESSDRDSREGNYKLNRLPFIISKDRPAIKVILDNAILDEFVVLYKDANGTQKIFGTLDNPVRFAYSYDTSASHSGRNGYSCEFRYEGPDNIFFYEGNVTIPPAGLPVSLVRWNGQVIGTLQPGEIADLTSEFKYTDFQINLNIS